jgi:ribonuclease Z
MEDDMEAEAKQKMHSTISQAIQQGKEMNARYMIMTHFSQRYAKIPRMENDVDKNVAIAFDNMELTLNDFPMLHLLYPPLKVMFQEHCQEMEEKALKRQYKKERYAPRQAENLAEKVSN